MDRNKLTHISDLLYQKLIKKYQDCINTHKKKFAKNPNDKVYEAFINGIENVKELNKQFILDAYKILEKEFKDD